MNDKYEFQVGDLVRLKSVEEILALGFWFNEQGGISYPNKKEVMLLSDELQYCGKEFVVKDVVDITAHNHITLDSPNSSVRIVNICPSVLELVEVEEEDWISKPDLKVKPGDKVRIKTHEELIETGWTFYGDNYFHSIDGESIVSGMHKFLGEVHTVEKIVEGVIKLEEDYEYWNWTSYMIAEIVEENTYEDQLPTLKVGDRVRIKTHEELLASGWVIEDGEYHYKIEEGLSHIEIVMDMQPYLGETCTVETIIDEYDNYAEFHIEEDGEWFYWSSYMVAEVITGEENTYRDEEGNPFDPNADYIEEEEYQPYCAVVDEIKNNPAGWVTCNQTQTIWEEQNKPTTWDKERIQHGFENLEMYNKGYDDGFQRALDLMKKEFGVEL